MMRVLVCNVACAIALASTGVAQSHAALGTTAGLVTLGGQRSEQAWGGVLEYDPNPWLSLYAMPALLHVSDTASGRTVSRSGLGDLPLVAAADYSSPAPGSPSIGAALVAVLPTGNAACGLGSGETATGIDLGVGLSPGQAHLSADASHSISSGAAQSTVGRANVTTLRLEAGYDVAPRWTGTASVGVDVGAADSALGRVIGAGVRHTLRSGLMITLDGSHGLTSAAPRWVLALGFGTAFAGGSPVTPTTPLRRLKTAFGGSTAGKITCR
jgi:Putative MetA-pathway of phenol degradation